MTLVNPAHHARIVGGLRGSAVPVHHFSLLASSEVMLERLQTRGDGPDSWPAAQLERGLGALTRPGFGAHLPTEGCTPGGVHARWGARPVRSRTRCSPP